MMIYQIKLIKIFKMNINKNDRNAKMNKIW